MHASTQMYLLWKIYKKAIGCRMKWISPYIVPFLYFSTMLRGLYYIHSNSPIVNTIKAQFAPHVSNGDAREDLECGWVAQGHNKWVKSMASVVWSVQLGKYHSMTCCLACHKNCQNDSDCNTLILLFTVAKKKEIKQVSYTNITQFSLIDITVQSETLN